MPFSEAEKQVLIAVKILERVGKPADREKLDELGRKYFDDDLLDWTAAYDSLIEQGMIRQSDDLFSLTAEGKARAAEVHTRHLQNFFSDAMLRSEKSAAHARLCEKLHGVNLCQFNMVDAEQLRKFLDLLNLNRNSRVVDLGCGVGLIAEYISDQTGAHVTGIDFAAGAVARAVERTRNRKNSLCFRTGDMNSLDLPPRSFDTVIALDTLYFTEDLAKTVGAMKAVTCPGGQMGLFYTQTLRTDESTELLQADRTRLAQALAQNNLDFRTFDFTDNEREFWRKSVQVVEEFREAFEAEGNLDLYKSRTEEARQIVQMVDSGRISRYLYHVKM